MARETDITRTPKFFTRKKGVTNDQLCERCRPHNHVILVKHGCDAIMFSEVGTRTGLEAAQRARAGRFIHMWCIHDEVVPECLWFFREVRAVR